MTQRKYTVKVHRDSDNSYWATVDELPGCFASGFTLDELSESIGGSIALYLADDGAPDSPPEDAPVVNIGEMRVTVAA
ncbi:MAG: type II toxin-antitoxin system HicB family antitoxin [Thermoleophilaceae bacterium]|nr:type II toxin-antitoxin system HicB family antitoxin [Thermoleophilaceae bacterium]